jgi:protein-glutamine gamma-glutamyltransferase
MARSLLLERFFRTLIYLLVATGFGMLVAADQISRPVFWLFVIFFGLSCSRRVAQHLQLTVRQANMITWLYVPIFLLDTFLFSKSFVPSTIHLILFVQILKLYQFKAGRDYFYLLVLSFLEVLASSSLTISTMFILLFLLFLFVGIAALMCLEMRRAADRRSTQDQRLCQPSGEPCQPQEQCFDLEAAEQRKAVRTILAISAITLLAVSFLGTVLFFAVPRFGSGYLSRTIGKTLHLSGFSDRIQLGSIGAIQLDPTVVMRVKISGGTKLQEARRWRGITLDHFDGRNWSKRIKGSAHSFPLGRSFKIREVADAGSITHYQVLLEACSTPYLFTLDQILSVKGNLDALVYDPVDDSLMARPHDFYRLIYQADSSSSPTPQLSSTAGVFSSEVSPAYLQLPNLDVRIPELAAVITSQAWTSQEKAAQLENYLQNHYRYSLSASQIEDPKPIATFLFEKKEGHCEYFASAMVIMLRTLGIPSRIVNGFRTGEYNEVAGSYIVRGRDAHSWVEAYLSEGRWQSYDPTPASAESFFQNSWAMQINHYLDAFELFWGEWVLGYDEIVQGSLFNDLQTKLAQWIGHGRYLFYQSVLQARHRLFWLQRDLAILIRAAKWKLLSCTLVAAIAGGLGFRLLRRISRRQRLNHAVRTGDGTLAIQVYSDMLRFFQSRGKNKPSGLTPREFVETFANGRVRRHVGLLTEIYNSMRFSKSPMNLEQIQQAYESLTQIKNLSKEGEV